MTTHDHKYHTRKPVHIVVVGSSNTDMVVRAPRLPLPGETVSGGAFMTAQGGKGANQAVAAARLGARVTFVCCVGSDRFGDEAIHGFQDEGIVTDYVVRDPDAATGVALIGVDETRGENAIIVAPGANHRLTEAHIVAAGDAIRSADALICQLEIPLEAVSRALRNAQEAGVMTILNPAPACSLPDDLLACVTVLTPNAHEAATLAGDDSLSPGDAARALCRRGVANVIVTLGAEGALWVTPDGETAFPGKTVRAVDTTAAGDCFTGALAVALAEGADFGKAIGFATAAAAISVTREGAQPSLPRREEIEE